MFKFANIATSTAGVMKRNALGAQNGVSDSEVKTCVSKNLATRFFTPRALAGRQTVATYLLAAHGAAYWCKLLARPLVRYHLHTVVGLSCAPSLSQSPRAQTRTLTGLQLTCGGVCCCAAFRNDRRAFNGPSFRKARGVMRTRLRGTRESECKGRAM